MNVSFEYPLPCLVRKDCDDVFDNITMFDLSFQTTVHYFKNHDTDFAELVVKVLGFGIRVRTGE